MSLVLLNLQSNQLIKLDGHNPLIIGRGNVDGCFDKRVSRNHGRITCTLDGKIRLVALHCNPCFFTRNGIPPVLQLNKDEEEILNEGDCLGLLPNAFWFQIKLNSEIIIKDEPREIDSKGVKLENDDSIVNDALTKNDIVAHENTKCMPNEIKGTPSSSSIPSPEVEKVSNSAGSSKTFGSPEFEKTRRLPLHMYEIDEPIESDKSPNKHKLNINQDTQNKRLKLEPEVKKEPVIKSEVETQSNDELVVMNAASTSKPKIDESNSGSSLRTDEDNTGQVEGESSNVNCKEGYESVVNEVEIPVKRSICQYEGNCYRKLGRNEKVISAEEKNERETGVVKDRSKAEVVTLEERPEEDGNVFNVSGFRMVLPQILAVSIINLILLDLGMVLAFPTIVIPDLLKSTGNMKFTEEQASWFGSAAFICQPLGSLFSGCVFDPIGRKKTMLYVNFPLLAGWLFIHFGGTITHLYVGTIIMGVAIGFPAAPHVTYLGEITQPKWRGILTSYAELCVAFGFCFVYFMGTVASWRTVAALCSSVPVFAIILITQIPESPIWLLSKGKRKKAERSLCWLRGWVKPHVIEKEFSDLVQHHNKKDVCLTERCPLSPSARNHQKANFGKKFFHKIGFDAVFNRSVLQPLFLVVAYFGFSHAAGVTSTRPFMVDILEEFGTPLNVKWVTAISSVVGMAGFISGMVLLPKTGKRLLSLISMFGCSIVNVLLMVYGFFYRDLQFPLIQVSLFVLLNFLWSVGIGQIPWMLISEVFPFKGRGMASSISAALSYVFAFIFTKSYYGTYNAFTLSGVFAFYGACTLLGGLFLYYYLPETEGKTLEQIEFIVEKHFNKFPKEDLNLTDEKLYSVE